VPLEWRGLLFDALRDHVAASNACDVPSSGSAPGRRTPAWIEKPAARSTRTVNPLQRAPRPRALPDRDLSPVMVRRLGIVSRDYPDVYEFLREYFVDKKDAVGVILDRRSMSTPPAGLPRQERRSRRSRPGVDFKLRLRSPRISYHPRMMRRHASVCPRPDPTHPIGDRHRRGPRGALGLLGPHPWWAIHRDPGAVVAARCACATEWSCPQAMAPAPLAMEVVVKKVLGYERDAKGGWAVLLEVEIGGTVQELCRLVFPSEAGIGAVRKFIADVCTTPRGDAD